jgi:hypothetical protein
MYNTFRFNNKRKAKNALDSTIRHLYLLKYEVNPYVAFTKDGQLIIHNMQTHERKPIAIKVTDLGEKTVIKVDLTPEALNPYNLNLNAIVDELRKIGDKTKPITKPTKPTIRGTRQQFKKTELEKITQRIADIQCNLTINMAKESNHTKLQQLNDLKILIDYIATGQINSIPSFLNFNKVMIDATNNNTPQQQITAS